MSNSGARRPQNSNDKPQITKYFLLTLALSLLAIAPLFYPGYFEVHSAFVPHYNLLDFVASENKWSWQPTIATDWNPLVGDGYLSYLLGALPLTLGSNANTAVRVLFLLGWLSGAAGMFLLVQRRLGPAGGTVAATLYTYLPFRLQTVYVRGAVGESLFWGLLPWAFLAVVRRENAPARLKGVVLAALVWLLAGASQLGLATLGLLMTLIITLSLKGWRDLPKSLGAFVGLAVAWAFTLLRGGPLPQTDGAFHDHYLYLFQLFSTAWGFGASVPGWGDGLSLQIGLAVVTFFVLTLALYPIHVRRNMRFVSLAGMLILLMFAPLSFVWSISGATGLLSYPWQLLGFVGFLLILTVRLDALTRWPPLLAGVLGLILLPSYGYLEPRYTQYQSDAAPRAEIAGRLMLLDYRIVHLSQNKDAGLPIENEVELPVGDVCRLPPGTRLGIRLLWQSTASFEQDYKLFVHLNDAEERLLAQTDALAGSHSQEPRLLSDWLPGELIHDSYELIIPEPFDPQEPCKLAIGLYEEETLERLEVAGAPDGRITLLSGGRP